MLGRVSVSTRLLVLRQHGNAYLRVSGTGGWDDVGDVAGPWIPLGGQKSLLLAGGPAGRTVHTASVCRAKNLLHKFLNKSRNKNWYESRPQTPSSLTLPRKRIQEDSPRCKVLNSLLFKAVSDLLTSAQVSHDLEDCSPEISKVSLAPDFSSCRVYWKSSGHPEKDNLVQKALDRNSSLIRYLIMSQQIMGGVPSIVFLRDKQHAAMAEVDRLLQQADFGPDPLDSHSNDGQFPLPVSVSGRQTGVVKPVLFGVDHELLNRQIADWRKKAKREVPEEAAAPELTEEQLAVLADYRKQQIIKKKKKKKKASVVDDDVTPREFLLARHKGIAPQWQEPYEGESFKQEEAQLEELMLPDRTS